MKSEIYRRVIVRTNVGGQPIRGRHEAGLMLPFFAFGPEGQWILAGGESHRIRRTSDLPRRGGETRHSPPSGVELFLCKSSG
jgi:hypothetical protein